jgi:trehalose 6-phosphate synthase/phosphatase
MNRLLIVSNRLPVTVKDDKDQLRVVPSAGGLATGLSGPHKSSGGMWIGGPGDVSKLDDARRQELDTHLQELRAVPVYLSTEEVTRFYDGFSNGVLWPLFHYLLDTIPIDSRDWEAYRAVNEKFADAVAAQYQPGDLIWVQDYQLCLLPGMLRQRLPDAHIGFFLHIPFPSTEVFRTLPWRDAILEGLLGADIVGFHTFAYLRQFTTSLLRILGVESNVDRVAYDGREIKLGVFPMGVDVADFARLAASDEVRAETEAIRKQGSDTQLLLGIDRLDYTKGIPRRLLAMERLLEREPSLRGKVRLVQLAVPSRTNVEAYADFRRHVDEIVGRVNGAYGTVHWTPIQYMYRSLSPSHVAAFYKAADAMLVTPLRDGMNLVAKEFVACRDDEDGVLVLSEFAGAAAELGEALLVNPYDIDGMAQAFKQALTMAPAERKTRMQGLRRRVAAYDVHRWADSFVTELEKSHEGEEARAPRRQDGVAKLTMTFLAQAKRASELLLLLDYDGTLVPFANTPEMARPDPELIALLTALGKRPHTRVHIVSGRMREQLEEYFGDLPIALHAEHGFWSRESPSAQWTCLSELPGEWKAQARHIFDAFASRTPGAMVEEKTASLAWHYRLADREFGSLQAKELLLHLANAFSNAPVEVIKGEKVVEVRPHGVNKGVVVRVALQGLPEGACILALGDDRTDEDVFAALPDSAFSVHVGRGQTRAHYRILHPSASRALLRAILDG